MEWFDKKLMAIFNIGPMVFDTTGPKCLMMSYDCTISPLLHTTTMKSTLKKSRSIFKNTYLNT